MAKPKKTKALAGHGRALVKAVTWRTVGTLDTFLWSYVVTGHPMAAGMIASMETFTKVVLYYLHERVWRVFKWSPASQLRSLTKAISWRFVGSLDTFMLSLIVTGNARYAVSIASIEAVTKIVLYYIHERVWRSVAWGRLEEDARSQQVAAPAPVPTGAEPAAEVGRPVP